jgi:hypothetical protein
MFKITTLFSSAFIGINMDARTKDALHRGDWKHRGI